MIRLSEAIREGMRYGGNSKRVSFVWTGSDGGLCGCALGGAGLVVGLRLEDKGFAGALEGKGKFGEMFPVSAHIVTESPTGSFRTFPSLPKPLAEVISLLFELYGWSKPAIAEYVETIERKLGLWDEPTVATPVALAESESKEAVKV